PLRDFRGSQTPQSNKSTNSNDPKQLSPEVASGPTHCFQTEKISQLEAHQRSQNTVRHQPINQQLEAAILLAHNITSFCLAY
ncbi:hypothetical protein ABTH66_19500, partial [Acinetobacter baumannii]